MTASVTIRPALPDDTAALKAFIHPFVEERILLPRTEDELVELTKNGFLAERESEIVGFAALEVYSPKLGEIRSLAVSGDVQGQGVGKRLVEACVNLAHEKNVLEVMAITSSERFFQSCGFDFSLPGERKALFIQTRDSH